MQMQMHKIRRLEKIIMNDNFIRDGVNLDKIKNHIFDILRDIQLEVHNVYIVGSITNRTIVFHIKSNNCLVVSLNRSISEIKSDIGFWFLLKNKEYNVSDHTSIITLTDDEIYMLKAPNIKLVVLYHEINFPFPRFALGVADIASSLRDFAIGSVNISDMQIGKTLDDVKSEIETERPDIIGFSVTFGQTDLLEYLLNTIYKNDDYHPLIVIGGSLAYFNRDYLLKKDCNIIICNSYGEKTMRDIVNYWLNGIDKRQIQGISFLRENNEVVDTPTPSTLKDWAIYGMPELDVLPDILKSKGVITLETSRGCMNACSFCPRKSKAFGKILSLII